MGKLTFKTSFFLSFLLAASTLLSFSQEIPPKITMNISYFGNNIWNPGFNIGVDFIHGIENGDSRKGDPYIRHKFFNADFGFYTDPGSHNAIFTHIGINHRKFQENKLNFNIGISPIGAYRSFLSETNEINETLEEKEVPVPGKFYYAPAVTLGMGKFRNNRPGTGWFFQIDIITLISSEVKIKPLLNTKLGWRMRII